MEKKKAYQYELWSKEMRFLYDSLRLEVLEGMKKRGIESIPLTCEDVIGKTERSKNNV